MPRFMNLAAACALAALMAPAAATAQTIAPTRIVAFGDSYADDGNVFQLTGTSQPIIYPTGRFSGGTNFIDSLQQTYGAEQINFAIGGAFSGPGNTGNNNISGPGIPGFQFEVASFLAGGGGVFPTVAPRFGPDDLLAVSIGGNDARAYELGGTGTVAGAAARAAISVAETRSGLDRLVAAGARNIAFLAGNVGELPEVRGTPVAAIGSAFSTAFNAGLQAPLSGYAANGVLVHYLDLTIVGNRIRANPAAYGLLSADACPTSCVLNPAIQAQYLFYVDRVHLTSAGFAIVAEYFQRQIDGVGTLGATGELGLSNARAFARTMASRNELIGVGGDPDRPFGFYLLGVTERRDTRGAATRTAYDIDDTGVTGGVEYNPGTGLSGGIALSFSQPEAEFARGQADVEADAYSIGAYASFDRGGLSLSGNVGYGRVDFDLVRAGVIDDLGAETDGETTSLGAEASYAFALTDRISVGPVVGITYARAKIDSYTEDGDAALTLSVDRQRLSELLGTAGLEAKANLTAGEVAVTPYLNALLAKSLDQGGGALRFAGTASPTIINAVRTGEDDDDVYGEIEAGASFGVSAALSAQIVGRATIERPGGNDYGGFAGLKLSF